MKKFINSVDSMLAESLDGFAAVHADIVALGEERKFVRRRKPNLQKVALVSGGGSGHEPMHGGFVGHGMLDAACPGAVFTSPVPDQMLAATKAVASLLLNASPPNSASKQFPLRPSTKPCAMFLS